MGVKMGMRLGKWLWLLGGMALGLLVIVGSMWSGDDSGGIVEVVEVVDSVCVEDTVSVSDFFPELVEEELEYRDRRGVGYVSSGIGDISDRIEVRDVVRSSPVWYGFSSRELVRDLVGSGKRGRYMEYHVDYSIDHMVRYGIPASLSLGQALKETGGGSRLSIEANNHFGIKAKHRDCVLGDWELNELNGFWMFPTTGDCYEYRSQMLTNCHYGRWISDDMDLDDWLLLLINGGRENMRWCPDDDYIDTIRAIIERYDLEKVDLWVESRYGIGV